MNEQLPFQIDSLLTGIATRRGAVVVVAVQLFRELLGCDRLQRYGLSGA